MLIHRRTDPALAEAAQRGILTDERLGLVTVAVLMKILNHAPEWNVNAQTFYEIEEAARGQRVDTRRSIQRAFRELEAAGYMRRTTGRQARGGFFTLLEVSDVPDDFTIAMEGRQHGVMPPEGDGLVYVVGPTGSSVVKIGTTTDVRGRVASIQTGHPLLLIARWMCPGNVELEGYLHRRFDEIRMQGEWFNFGDADPIAVVCAAAEDFYQLGPGALASRANHETTTS